MENKYYVQWYAVTIKVGSRLVRRTGKPRLLYFRDISARALSLLQYYCEHGH